MKLSAATSDSVLQKSRRTWRASGVASPNNSGSSGLRS